MRHRATASLAAVLAVVFGGCGTVVNCINCNGRAEREIYGGVKQDAQNGSRHLSEAFSGSPPTFTQIPKPPSAGRDFAAKTFCAGCGVGMLAVDLPVSVVTDTLTLPLTVPATLMKKKTSSRRKAKPSPPRKPSSTVPPSPPMPATAQVKPAIPNW